VFRQPHQARRGKQALVALTVRHGGQRVGRLRLLDRKAARRGTTQCGEMRSRAQRGADILAERAYVRAFAATDPDLHQRRREA